MKNIKTYRLVHKYTSYSKKKGAYEKGTIIAKDIATYDEAVALIKKDYPNAIIKDGVARNVGGLLYPSRILIQ